jgi:hypothetical protein
MFSSVDLHQEAQHRTADTSSAASIKRRLYTMEYKASYTLGWCIAP